jgi:hypothetical protein
MQHQAPVGTGLPGFALEYARPVICGNIVDTKNRLKTISYKSVRASVSVQHPSAKMASLTIFRPESKVKTIKKCYFSSATISTLFLLETFLPIQIF